MVILSYDTKLELGFWDLLDLHIFINLKDLLEG